MLGWLKKIRGRTENAAPAQLTNAALARRYLALARSGALRARYDAAVTTDDNRRHWANADALSADAAANADVRRTLRNRARYEVANNSYARGIVLTLANDTIGTGPRLQILTRDQRLRTGRPTEKVPSERSSPCQGRSDLVSCYASVGCGVHAALPARAGPGGDGSFVLWAAL